MERQIFDWIVPYHDGAVRYFKEIGVWNEEHERHNFSLIKRQEVLGVAWDEFIKNDIADESFYDEWMRARFVALNEAGMDTVWTD